MTVDTGSRKFPKDSTYEYFTFQIIDFEGRCDALSDVATMEAYSNSKLAVFKKRGIKKLVWRNSGSEVICIVCIGMTGVEFDIDKAEGLIPNHIHCECFWSEI